MHWKMPLYVLLNGLLTAEVCVAAAFVGYLFYQGGQDASMSLQHTVTLCGFFLLPILALNLWLAERLTLPLAHLTQATQNFAVGKSVSTPACNHITEIATLSEAFAQMMGALSEAEQLRQHYAQTLEQQVTEKTAALQKRAAQLREAQRIAMVGSWELELTTRQTTWSEELFRIVGMAPISSGLVQFDIRDVVHPEDWNRLNNQVERAISDGTSYRVEHRVVLPDGAIRHVISRGEVTCSEAGQTVSLSGTVADITQHVLAEAALHKSEARLQRLASNIVGMLYQYVLHPDGSENYSYISPKCREIYEQSPEELMENSELVSAMVHPDDAERLRQASQRSASTLAPLDIEFRLLPPSGGIRWVRAASQPELQATGDIVWDGIVLDVTTQKQLEQTLRQRERESRAILSAIPDLMVRMGADGTHLERVTYRPEIDVLPGATDCTGLQLQDLLPPEMAEQKLHYIQQALKTGELQIFEQRVQVGDRYQDEEVRIVKSGESEVLLMVRDISDRKAAEENLRRYERIVSATADGIALLDCNYVYQIVNRTCLNRGGRARDEFLGHSALEINGEAAFQSRIKPHLDRCLQGEIVQYEDWFNYGVLGRRFISVNYSPYHEVDGTISGVIVSTRDITALKKAESALAHSELTNRVIVETIPDLLIQMDRQGQCNRLMGGGAARAQQRFQGSTELKFPSEVVKDLRKRRLDYAHRALDEKTLQVYEQSFEIEGDRCFEEVRIAPLNDQEVLVIIRDISERKQIEQALLQLNQQLEAKVQERTATLQEREARYRALVEIIPDLLVRMDADGTYLDIVVGDGIRLFNPNQVCLEAGTHIYDVLPAERVRERMARIHRALETQEIQAETYELPFEDGPRTEEARIIAINDREVLVIVQDITERIWTQKALRQSEERWQFALEGAGDGVWDWNCQTDVVFYSHRWKAMLGYSDSEIGNTLDEWDSRIHPDDKPRCYADFDRHFGGETAIYQNEHRMRCKDGSYKWILDRGKVIEWTPEGKPLRVIGTHTDMTERRQAEQTIREQAALLEIASDAIMVRSLDHVIRFWNQGAEQLFGWQAEDAIGQDACSLLQLEGSKVEAVVQILLEAGEWQGELPKVTKSGQAVIVQSRWTLVRDEAGQPKFILTVDTNITQQKQLEAQFYQAQRLDSLGKLSSGIAHDLNNILTPILTLSQLLRLRQVGLDQYGLEQIGLIETSAKRGAELVQQVLTFVQGSRDDSSLIDVAALLEEVVNIIQQSFPKSIEVCHFIEAPAPLLGTVNANKTQLHQVLMNLCINSRDAMAAGGLLALTIKNVTVDKALAATHPGYGQPGKTYVVVTVDDTGTGIAPEVRDRIFEPFFTTKGPGQGTGLGLSTALGIVQNYGGFIQVDSKVGQGTSVAVYLPVASGTIEAKPPQAEQLEGNGDRILIVDDDAVVQQSIQVLVENYRYTTLVASSAPEALQVYRQHQEAIRLVISDITMPGMGGIAFIEQLKQINPTVQVVAISGLVSNQQPALSAGATVFLAKPYTPDKLIGTIRSLVGRDEFFDA